MRIVVLGATSRTGLQLLAQARRRGHQIVAFTRRPEALPDSPALAAVIRGDGRDPSALITAMPRAGVDRLVVVSAYPIAGDRPRLPIWVLRRVLATPYADVAQTEQIVTASDLDWAIARLNRLTSKPGTGAITTSTGLLDRARPHTRADTAAVLLDLAERPAPARTAVNLTGA